MATKTITIMEDAYKLLLLNKRREESFSDELRRLITKKKDIMEFAGAWEMSDEEAEEMKKNIKNISKVSTKKLIERFGHKEK